MKVDPDASDVTVVLPAAGSGTRLGGERKQFRRLGDAPLLVQTLRGFDRHRSVKRLVIVCPAADVDSTTSMLGLHRFRADVQVVPGGATRQESVRLGLRAVPEDSPVVLIHDAVRPFVSGREISEVVSGAREHGAAAVAIPVADTLRYASGDRFGVTVDRAGLYRMQTPQGFSRLLIVEAHEAARTARRPATDDVEVAQMAGHDVYLVHGSTDNFKITTPEDWHRARQIWPSWRSRQK